MDDNDYIDPQLYSDDRIRSFTKAKAHVVLCKFGGYGVLEFGSRRDSKGIGLEKIEHGMRPVKHPHYGPGNYGELDADQAHDLARRLNLVS